MKVQLEYRTDPCRDKLLCTVCGQLFETAAIRALLYNQQHFLQGDVCPECMRLSQTKFRQKLHDRGNLLLKLSRFDCHNQSARRYRALELLATAKEAVHFPAPYQWWWKRLTLLSNETAALEAARRGDNYRTCEARSRLERLLVRDGDRP